MRIILLNNIPALGNKYDVKKVADGYARNFLFPKRLAKLATKSALSELEKWHEIEKKKQEKELKKFQEIVKKLNGQEIEIPMKTGEGGALYGSITLHKVAEVLGGQKFDIIKEQIVLKEPIKELGEYSAIVKFPHNLEATVKIIVTAEK